MEKFLSKHGKAIKGVIGCFDRVVFKGYLPISSSGSMENFMAQNGLLIKDFKKFVLRASARVKGYALGMAKRTGRPMRPYLLIYAKRLGACRNTSVFRGLCESVLRLN